MMPREVTIIIFVVHAHGKGLQLCLADVDHYVHLEVAVLSRLALRGSHGAAMPLMLVSQPAHVSVLYNEKKLVKSFEFDFVHTKEEMKLLTLRWIVCSDDLYVLWNWNVLVGSVRYGWQGGIPI